MQTGLWFRFFFLFDFWKVAGKSLLAFILFPKNKGLRLEAENFFYGKHTRPVFFDFYFSWESFKTSLYYVHSFSYISPPLFQSADEMMLVEPSMYTNVQNWAGDLISGNNTTGRSVQLRQKNDDSGSWNWCPLLLSPESLSWKGPSLLLMSQDRVTGVGTWPMAQNRFKVFFCYVTP